MLYTSQPSLCKTPKYAAIIKQNNSHLIPSQSKNWDYMGCIIQQRLTTSTKHKDSDLLLANVSHHVCLRL